MSFPNSITRDDLIQASVEITTLDTDNGRDQDSSVILLNSHRYDPRAILTQALRNKRAVSLEEINAPGNDTAIETYFMQRAIPMIRVSALNSAVSLLKALQADPSVQKDLKEVIVAKDGMIGKYRPLFSREKIQKLTESDIWGFLNFNNNKHWSGLARQKKEITSDMDTKVHRSLFLHRYQQRKAITSDMYALRDALFILVDETRPIDERFNKICPIKRDPMIKGFGPAIITAFLQVSNPDKYGIWNRISENGWVTRDLWPAYNENLSFGSYYLTVNEILKALAREVSVDLWTLDALWYKIDWFNVDHKIDPQESEIDQFEAIINIAHTIAKNGLDNKKLSQSSDAQVNRDRYNTIIKPHLDKFKIEYKTSPQLYLNEILERVLSKNSLSENYENRGYHFVGRKVHSFTWAAITRKDISITNQITSFNPQLFITVNPEGVRFGFAQGYQGPDSAESVAWLHFQSELSELVVTTLKTSAQIRAFRNSTDDTMLLHDDDITDELLKGDFRKWTQTTLLVESYDMPDIPEDLENRIVSTLSTLVPVFLLASELEKVEPEPAPTWSTVAPSLACSFAGDQIPFAGLHFPNADKQRLSTEILGALRSGKHIILTGPPGTGKSKIAQAVCAAIAGPDNFQMCTASPDWSVYETIGGYRPKSDNTLRFHPGAFLRSFRNGDGPANRWLIIDEINRADIDKAFGSLFSALAGDRVDLPFEIDDEPVCLVGRPEEETPLKPCTFIIHPDWRIIATMNTFDKSSLYEMSYAFMRRFAFIMVDSPQSVDAILVGEYARAWKFEPDEERCRQVAELWNLVNRHRKIGPALFRDIYQYFDTAPGAEMESAVTMYLFPQLEGLPEETQKSFITDLLALESIVDTDRLKQNAATFFHLDIRGFT